MSTNGQVEPRLTSGSNLTVIPLRDHNSRPLSCEELSRAATTVVRPIADNIANELNEPGNRLDQQIRNDLIANATIDFITSVLRDVSRLRAITDAHQA